MDVRNEDKEIHNAANRILKEYNLTSLLVTRSEKGMSYIAPEASQDIPTEAREVYDVSGAGDTVRGNFSSCAGQRYPYCRCLYLANKAAGIVDGKIGTSPSVQRVAGRATNRETGQQTYSYSPTCRYYKTTACAGAQNHIHKRLLRHSAQRTRVLSGKGQKTGGRTYRRIEFGQLSKTSERGIAPHQ